MKKNKGSILLETMISLGILLIGFTITLNLTINLIKTQKIRTKNETMNTNFTAVCSEVKYNIEYMKLKEKLKSGEIIIKYSDDLIYFLINSDLFSLECNNLENNRIEILKISEGEDYIKIKIIYKEGQLEQEIIKAQWMDEI